MTARETSDTGGKPNDPRRPKKPYVAPKLIDYGSTSKLSAGKPGLVADSGKPQLKACL